MKKTNDYIFEPTVLLPITQLFVSNEVFWIIGFVLFCYIVVVKNNCKIYIPFPEYKLLFVFLLWGSVLGGMRFVYSTADVRDFMRDLFYYSTPIIYIYLGSWYAKRLNDLSRICNSFILSGAIVSVVSLIRMYQATGFNNASMNVHEWRSSTSGGAIIIGVSLAIAFSGIIPKEKELPVVLRVGCLSLSLLFFLFSLSRTNLFIIVVMYLVLTIDRNNAKKLLSNTFILITVGVASIWLMTIVLPDSLLKEYAQKVLLSLSEISTNNTWTDAKIIQRNWRGYENYCAVKQWLESDLFSQLFGCGFGKRVTVGRFAYTFLGQLYSDGTPAEAIAVLHNGYATQLIKLGVMGVVLYVFFYIRMIVKGLSYSKRYMGDKKNTAKLLLAVSVCLLIQTMFLNGLFRDYCYYPLITLVGYTAESTQYSYV